MRSLRPSGFDELGLRRAMSDRMLPLLAAAMAFLAALALAGWFGTAGLARHRQEGARAGPTVQGPQPRGPARGAKETPPPPGPGPPPRTPRGPPGHAPAGG